MLPAFGATAQTTLIPKQRLQPEISSLFLRLLFCWIRIDCWLRFSFQADNQRAISAPVSSFGNLNESKARLLPNVRIDPGKLGH